MSFISGFWLSAPSLACSRIFAMADSVLAACAQYCEDAASGHRFIHLQRWPYIGPVEHFLRAGGAAECWGDGGGVPRYGFARPLPERPLGARWMGTGAGFDLATAKSTRHLVAWRVSGRLAFLSSPATLSARWNLECKTGTPPIRWTRIASLQRFGPRRLCWVN